mmetsp:Transcript_76565/g.165679  ORF Transcript_76565/g.165679 Transcript_76565/m.165679 type:complete len:282 (+) Transcript_76565:577-1422(+)
MAHGVPRPLPHPRVHPAGLHLLQADHGLGEDQHSELPGRLRHRRPGLRPGLRAERRLDPVERRRRGRGAGARRDGGGAGGASPGALEETHHLALGQRRLVVRHRHVLLRLQLPREPRERHHAAPRVRPLHGPLRDERLPLRLSLPAAAAGGQGAMEREEAQAACLRPVAGATRRRRWRLSCEVEAEEKAVVLPKPEHEGQEAGQAVLAGPLQPGGPDSQMRVLRGPRHSAPLLRLRRGLRDEVRVRHRCAGDLPGRPQPGGRQGHGGEVRLRGQRGRPALH